MSFEQKMRLGADFDFTWVAPKPVLSTPSLTVQWSSGSENVTLYAASTLTVSGHDARDGNVLEVGASPTASHLGPCFLVTKNIGVLSTRIVSIDPESTTVTLSEPLPRTYRPETGDLLVPSTWRGVIEARAECERDVRWILSSRFVMSPGGDTYGQCENGTLHVVFQPFSTGLTSEEVSRKLANLGTPPASAQGWDDVIEAAEDELIALLRDRLVTIGLTEDDVQAPQSLRTAHLSLVAAHHLLLTEPEKAKELRVSAKIQVDQVFKRIHLDNSRDGSTPHGEVTSTPSVRSSVWGNIPAPFGRGAL